MLELESLERLGRPDPLDGDACKVFDTRAAGGRARRRWPGIVDVFRTIPSKTGTVRLKTLDSVAAVVEEADVVVIGAGQAGLSVSHELKRHGISHLVVERGSVGQTWRRRWDSFCLVLPNWTVQLPGGRYEGPHPDAYMMRDDLVAYLEAYAAGFEAPVRHHTEVTSLRCQDGALPFALETSSGEMHARIVVIATGAYQRPVRPKGATELPVRIEVFDADSYVNPGGLPPGGVLIVGSGQTGCQMAEELREAGREVVLACGRTPWMPRRIEGRDAISWLTETPFFEAALSDLPSPLARLAGNPQASGRDGGHDLHYRTLARLGVRLVGHFRGVSGSRAHFAGDLAECVAVGDARYADIRNLIHAQCDRTGTTRPEIPDPEPFLADDDDSLDLGGVGSVILTSGFRPDYASWVRVPGAFDEWGFPKHIECESTMAPGLFFVGVHFLRKRKSSLLFGVGEDATIVAERVVQQSEVS
jgi:putative flavoprotein involved in K+ transport